MNSTRIAIVVLILLGVLFASTMLLTDRSNSSARGNNKDLNKMRAPDWVKSFGKLLGPKTPKLKLNGSPFKFEDSLERIQVPPAEDDFRTATFHLKSGTGVKIEYFDETSGAGEDLRHQTLELPREKSDSDDDPRRGTLTILKAGGRLEIKDCKGGPCEVVVE